MIAPPFESRSDLYGAIKPFSNQQTVICLSSETIKMSALPLTCSERSSNLFLIELMFRWAKTNLFKLLQHKDFNKLLPSVFFGQYLFYKGYILQQ